MKDILFVEDQMDDMTSTNNIINDIATTMDNENDKKFF